MASCKAVSLANTVRHHQYFFIRIDSSTCPNSDGRALGASLESSGTVEMLGNGEDNMLWFKDGHFIRNKKYRDMVRNTYYAR